MITRPFQDETLAALAQQLSLGFPAGTDTWLASARQRLGEALFQELQTRRGKLYEDARRAAESGTTVDEAEFYRFVAGDAAVSSVMLEGRLGYYDAVLPAIAARMETMPHARLLDLGSYTGLATLYLARRFPDARIVGIERGEEAVERARDNAKRAGARNVEFRLGDYTRLRGSDAFDVVLSLQTMPTYLLPRVPAEEPESYLRGSRLAEAKVDASSPAHAIVQALAACARWTAPGGRVILQERFREYPEAALFMELVHRAGLAPVETALVSWQTANEREGVQQAPLVVAERREEPVPFDEAAFLRTYIPALLKVDLASPQLDHGVILTGPTAHANFQALPAGKRDVCVSLRFAKDVQVHLHLGVVAGQAAYVYTCSTADHRELKMCRPAHAQALFAPVLEFITSKKQSGEALHAEPDPAVLPGLLRTTLAS